MIFTNSQGIEARGSLIRLSRQMIVFEVYNPYSIVQLSEVLGELRIQQGERETYKGRAVITNLVNTGLMLIVSASLVDPWSDLKGLEPGTVLRSYVHDFVEDWEVSNSRLDQNFQLNVTNIRNYLQELSRWLEHWETEAGMQTADPNSERMRQFVLDVDHEIEPRLTALFGDFENVTRSIEKKYTAYHRSFAQRELHPLMMSSPFMNRAFNKPLGYAGDFEMVRMMLGDPWEGGNTFAKLLNVAALRHEAPAAHRNRIELLQQALSNETQRILAIRTAAPSAHTSSSDGRVKIMNLGCGPAVEIAELAKSSAASAQVDFDLIDFNTETLEHVNKNLIPELKRLQPEMQVQTEQRSVHEIIQQSVERADDSSKQQPKYDIVYCAGLFDYFRDTTCGFLIELFYSWVKDGGMVLVTNVTPSHSSLAIMGMILDWNLELRDESMKQQLVPGLGQQKTYVDQTGVNVFLEIRKTKS